MPQSTNPYRGRIFISAGEASGDAYGAALVSEIRRLTDAQADPLQNIFGRALNDSHLLADLGAVDSLEIVEYMMACEDEFGIDIPDEDVPKLRSIGDVREYIELKTGRLLTGAGEPIQFQGIGGPKLRAQEVTLYADSSRWGAISIAQAARVFFRVYLNLQRIKGILSSGRPGLFIPIDFGFANIRLARYAKKKGWKVLYFVPPGSWRRDKQGKDLPQVADQIVTPFPWSAEILNEMGAKAHWFGHPIKQLIRAGDNDSPPDRRTLAVLPGSRTHELERNLPFVAEIVRDRLDIQIEFALAPSLNAEEVRATWEKVAPGRHDVFRVGDTRGVLLRGKAGIVCSGTATLEAAMCRCPMLVLYILSPAMKREAKIIRMKRPKFISLPNIIMDREVVPEFADYQDPNPDAFRACLLELLGGGQKYQDQIVAFDELDRLLGPEDAITKTAELALNMMDSPS